MTYFPIVFLLVVFVVFPFIIIALIWFMFSTVQRQARLRDHGIHAPATIVKLNPIVVTSRFGTRQSLLVQVHPPGGTPFETTVITRKNDLQPFPVGMTIQVIFDPQNQKDVIAERI